MIGKCDLCFSYTEVEKIDDHHTLCRYCQATYPFIPENKWGTETSILLRGLAALLNVDREIFTELPDAPEYVLNEPKKRGRPRREK